MSQAQTTAPALDSLDALMGGLSSAALRPVQVPAPELGGAVFVMRMTVAEWLDPKASERQTPATATERQQRGWTVGRWLCNAEGARIVAPDNLAALDLLGALPFEVAHRILNAAGVFDGADQKNA